MLVHSLFYYINIKIAYITLTTKPETFPLKLGIRRVKYIAMQHFAGSISNCKCYITMNFMSICMELMDFPLLITDFSGKTSGLVSKVVYVIFIYVKEISISSYFISFLHKCVKSINGIWQMPSLHLWKQSYDFSL